MNDDAARSAAEPAKPTTPQEWSRFLQRHGDLYLRTANEYVRSRITAEQWRTRWLGRDPAAEEDIAAAEQRLGVRFPPTLRGFLLTCDGWHGGGTVDEVHACAEIGWLRDSDAGQDLIEIYGFGVPDDGAADDGEWDGGEPEPVRVFERALEVGSGDGEHWLLDPTRAAPDGEWPAYAFLAGDGFLDEFTDFAALFRDGCDFLVRCTADGPRTAPGAR
ncbi:hypothetical protein GCM10027570_00670 [Streptomonospora sediminis]